METANPTSYHDRNETGAPPLDSRTHMMLLSLLMTMTALAAGPRASSELENDDGAFKAVLAFDGLLQTGWAEGEVGPGEVSGWSLISGA